MDDDEAEDDIAIIGVGCRYPGADNIEEFWQVLVNEQNHVLDIPQERWNNDAFFDEDKNAHRKLYTRKAGFLKRHDEWDNHVFGISDIEASRVDPQQRYVLECVHMAMEDGGITRHRLNGSRTGVYMGYMNNDYKSLMKGETSQTSYSSTGMSPTLIAARVSYVFNLTGPCLVLDTACSSSLIAIHLGCQALRTGDCDLAICGGVNSILTPETFFPLCENHMMSTIGQCQAFCDTADGYARGEGCGVVILQLVKQAVREGNKIWATIKTGTNQDGCAVHPITAPSGEQQRELLESTYKRYHVDPCDVQYIEAHGTGTPIGDPTEVNALGIFFSKHRTQRCLSEALLIGSVKSNIGHTESAAGVAGLIKVLLMMKQGSIVPTLHVKKDKSNVNKAILFEKYGLDIALQPCTWPLNKNNKRVACINSFGFGGSNCHAVLTQVNKSPDEKKGNIIADLNIACISVHDEQSLKLSLEAFQRDIETSNSNISDICYTSCCRRDHLTSRIALVGRTKQEIQSVCKLKLSKISQRQHRHDEQNIVFVYCGVGTSWKGMCREMMSKVDVFRETIEVIDSYLLPLCGWRIGEKFRENTNYDDPFLNHIAIFSSQVALTEVWKRWGVQPDAIVGMSVGEVAAAYGSGHLSIQDAVKVIYHRSKILAGQTGGTMMVVMNLEVPKVETLCKQYQHQAVCVAVYSSPIDCTISGNANEIDSIKETLEVQGKKANMRPIYLRKLNVQCAYHSPQVENCREEVIKQIGNLIDSTELTTQHISTVTGNIAAHGDFKTGEYWAGNVTKPVLLMQGIRKTLKQNTRNIFIEIGPRPVLRAHLSNILPDGINGLALASMRDNIELQSMYFTLSELYELGIDITWNTIYKDSGTLTPIPRYVFNKMKTLHVSDTAKLYLAGVNSNNEHSHLFIRRSASSQGHNQFQLLVNNVSTPFVYDHFLSGVVLVPGATYVEMGFHIGIECMKQPINNLTVSIVFEKPFTPKPGHEYTIDVSTTAAKDGGIMFKATSNARVLCTGEVSLRTIPERPSLSIEGLQKKLTKQIEKKECYTSLGKLDFQYGEQLSMIERAWSSDTECLAEILVSDYVANDFVETHIHPAVLDAFFQTFGICIASTGNNYAMPKGASAIVVDRPLKRKMYAYASQIYKTDSGCSYNAVLLTPNGSVISEVNDFHTRTVRSLEHRQRKEYCMQWVYLSIDARDNIMDETRVLFVSLQRKPRWIEELQGSLDIDFVNARKENILIATQATHYKSILFCAAQSPYQTEDGRVILDVAKENFLALRELLNVLYENKISIPVYAVTECTQNIPDRQSKSINLNGSELWGMVRSTMQEGVYADIRIVDVDPQNIDVKLLCALVTGCVTEHSELCLSGSKILVPKLSLRKKSFSATRYLKMDHRYQANLVSESPNEVLNLYFRFTENGLTASSLPKKNHFRVRLKTFTKHDSSVYLPTVEVPSPSDIWPGISGYQVVAIEGRGTVLDDSTKTTREVVFCCPVDAATCVIVPEECVMNTDRCRSYTPGALTLGNILYNMIMMVQERSDVVVVASSKDKANFVRLLCTEWLEEKACRNRFVTVSDLGNDTVNMLNGKETVALIATYLNKKQVQTIVQRLPSLRRIVSLNNLITDKLQVFFKHTYQRIEITTLVTSILFYPDALTKSIPKVAAMIIRISKELFQTNEMILGNTHGFSFNLPMEEINIESAINENSISLRVDKRGLFQKEACYILIGGLSGLGWELLQLLASIGAGYIITISRSIPKEGQIDVIKSIMQKHKCFIMSVQADITDSDSLDSGLKRITTELKHVPIKGIFHGAGVLADAMLITQTDETIKMALKPKIQGAWNLHIKSVGFPLDYFVLHSSVVSIIGNAGQCNYAAGNSFMDSLAFYRRSIGLPAQTINWGALSVGMGLKNETHLRKRGFSLLGIEDIRKYFVKALLINDTQVVYADINWKVFTEMLKMTTQRAKYDTIVQPTLQTIDEPEKTNRLMLTETDLIDISEKEMKEKLTDFVKAAIYEVVVLDDEDVDENSSLVSLGIDSMAAMSFANTIDGALKVKIPFVTLMSDETNVSTVVTLLADNIRSDKHVYMSREDQTIPVLSESISFMQHSVLKMYMKKKDDPSLYNIVDIEMKILTQYANWVTILGHVMKMNPELRTKYKVNADNPEDVNVMRVSEEEIHADLEEVPLHVIKGNGDLSIINEQRAIDFDLEKDLPIRFQIAFDNGSTFLRMILHEVVTDISSVSHIFKDILMTGIAFRSEKDLPATRPDIDIPGLLRKRIQPEMSALAHFWRYYMDLTIEPVTLGRTLSPIHSENCMMIVEDLADELVQQMTSYTRKRGISVFHFVTAIYQLYLHIFTKQERIPVTTVVDMRIHLPELIGIVAQCGNFIPIVSRIQGSMSLQAYLLENAEQMLKVTQNSAYPYDLILNEVKTQSLRDNLKRHYIVMNEMSILNNVLDQGRESNFKLTNFNHRIVRTTHETFLHVQQDSKSNKITFEFGFNTERCQPNHGRIIPKRLMELMAFCIQTDSKTILDLRNEVHDRWSLENIDSGSDQPIYYGDNISLTETFPVCTSTHNLSHQIQTNVAAAAHGEDDTLDQTHNQKERRNTEDILFKTGSLQKQTSQENDHRVPASLHAAHDDDQQLILKTESENLARKGHSQ